MTDEQTAPDPDAPDPTAPDPTAPDPAAETPDALARLAALHGVASSYEDYAGERVAVARDVVVRVLGLLGVDATDDDAVSAALAETETAPWRRLVAPSLVVRTGSPATLAVRAPAGADVTVAVRLEDGGEAPAPTAGEPAGEREVDGVRRVETPWRLPELPLGHHAVDVRAAGDAGEETASAVLVVAPERLELPAGLDRAWGWMTQLYSVRSAGGWGTGDYADLADLVRWSGGLGRACCS